MNRIVLERGIDRVVESSSSPVISRLTSFVSKEGLLSVLSSRPDRNAALWLAARHKTRYRRSIFAGRVPRKDWWFPRGVTRRSILERIASQRLRVV